MFLEHERLSGELPQAVRVFAKRFSEVPQYRAKLRFISGNSSCAKVPDAVFQATGGHPTDYNYPE